MRYLVTERCLCKQILDRLWGSWDRGRRGRKGCHKSSLNRMDEPETLLRYVDCWISWNCLSEMSGDKNLFSRCVDAALLAALLKQAIASRVSVTIKPCVLLRPGYLNAASSSTSHPHFIYTSLFICSERRCLQSKAHSHLSTSTFGWLFGHALISSNICWWISHFECDPFSTEPACRT